MVLSYTLTRYSISPHIVYHNTHEKHVNTLNFHGAYQIIFSVKYYNNNYELKILLYKAVISYSTSIHMCTISIKKIKQHS